jgi:transposase
MLLAAQRKNLIKLIMERYKFFLGVDVSKNTLDYCLRKPCGGLEYFCGTNDTRGHRNAFKWMSHFPGFGTANCLVCLEHTGIYSTPPVLAFHAKGFPVWLESAVRIRQGSGSLLRGKSDKIDAGRIADYAFRFHDRARLWEKPREVIDRLKVLFMARACLMKVCRLLSSPVNEMQAVLGKGAAKALQAYTGPSLAKAKEGIKAVEKKIRQLIDGDGELKQMHALVTSVKGVGEVTAVALILATNEFKEIKDPRQLACHAGCAPFPHQSGTSIRGRTRVSKKADKHLKSLLHLCANSAAKAKGELRDYYERKVTEGKHKMVVMNALRNKIIHRVYACIRDQRAYSDQYKPA